MIRQRLSHYGAFAVIVAVATVATLALFDGLPFFGAFERWFENYRIATQSPPEDQHPDIVIVTITDDTIRQFPYASPIDRGFLADVLELVQARGARGVLLDVLFDRPSEPAKDARLKQVIEGYKVPLVVSYGREAENLTPDEIEFIDAYLPADKRAFANLVKDDYDGTVRGIYPGRALPDGAFLPGIATRLVEQLGRSVGYEPRSLAYRAPKSDQVEAFAELPAHSVLAIPVVAAKLAGKIVLIGAEYAMTDRHRSPWATVRPGGDTNDLPGIVFHAHAVAQLLEGRQAPEIRLAGRIAIVFGAALIGMILGALDISVALRIGAAIVIVMGLFLGGLVLFRWVGVLLPVFAPGAALGLAVWMAGTYIARRDRAERQFVSTAFTRYLSPRLLKDLMANPEKLKVAAERHELSFIFTDVAGFTTVSEQLDAAELAGVLNRYFDGMTKIIQKHDGLVDKFIGDAVFAIFNAFDDQPDHVHRAVVCALELDDFATQFHTEETMAGRKFGHTRIGVHTGEANIGNFGSFSRFEFTALGDAVNTAARLEGLNKYFGTHVAVSGAAAKQCPDQLFRPLGQVVLKGKTEAIEVFEPLTEERAASSYMAEYLRAYALMERSSPDAYRVLADLGQANPHDVCVALHLERVTAGVGGIRIVMEDK